MIPEDADTIVLQTVRSHDQWNTTIYSNDDRYRRVKNIREIVFMNADDMAERGISRGDAVHIVATSKDGSRRSVDGFRVVDYDLPRGSATGYSELSDQPLMKGGSWCTSLTLRRRTHAIGYGNNLS